MALNRKKVQKKREKKAAKRKALIADKKTPAAVGRLSSGERALSLAASSPLYECLMAEELFDAGLGTVVVSRSMPAGRIGASFFLLDVFCLGVKNAYFLAMSEDEYAYRLDTIELNETLRPVSPSYARKLVEETEAYARNLGFSPHPDYQKAKRIFADIDATACAERFPFGKDGKPFFIAGPNETSKKIEKILATLTQHCGPGGFDYLVGLEDDFDEEDEFEFLEEESEFDDEDALEVDFVRIDEIKKKK
ncbi:MAG TPA: hypothetical protein VNN62_04925 [Methylomirabilota bacterium]|jgi:hypothetical protein|nr:hypothetical protein [Methylomirabilota bacterium]